MKEKPTKKMTWLPLTWSIIQIIILAGIATLLLLNPIGEIGDLIITVGISILVINFIRLLVATKRSNLNETFAAIVEGLLGLLLVFNSFLPPDRFTIFIGIFIIMNAVINLGIRSISIILKNNKTSAKQTKETLPSATAPETQPKKLTKRQVFWQKRLPAFLTILGSLFIIFPMLGLTIIGIAFITSPDLEGLAMSRLLAMTFGLIALYKTGELF